MALSTYLANKLLDHVDGKTSFTMPATVYLCLYTTNPTAADSGTECVYTGYARKLTAGADWNAASSASVANANAFTYAAKTGGTDATITHWGTRDASSSGNLLEFGAVTTSKLIQDGDNPNFPAGSIVRTAS